MSVKIEEVDALFKEANLAGLSAIVKGGKNIDKIVLRRATQLLGDLLFQEGNYEEALVSYQKSHKAISAGNASSLFGIAACYFKIGDIESYSKVSIKYASVFPKRLVPLSRLLLLSSEINDSRSFGILLETLETQYGNCKDPTVFQRIVRAMTEMGISDNIDRVAQNAMELPELSFEQICFFKLVISNTTIRSAEVLFKEGKLEALRQLLLEISNPHSSETRRTAQLLGDLLMRAGDYVGAIEQFKLSHDALPVGNFAAIFGNAICHAKLGRMDDFERLVKYFTKESEYNEALLSRLLMHAAEESHRPSFDIVFSALKIDPTYSKDVTIWHRVAKALILMEQRDAAAPYIKTARDLAEGDSNMLLLVAELDYDISVYWERRYNSSQGDRTPLMVNQQTDDAYQQVTKRDHDFLDATLIPNQLGLKRLEKHYSETGNFGHVVDCGCGSGRLVPYLSKKAETLSCFDISQTAIEFAQSSNANIKNASFKNANLADYHLPENTFDLVFDFTAVQHVVDQVQWQDILQNYVHACTEGGLLYLFEAIGDDKRKDLLHQSNASPERYIRVVEECGGRFLRRINAPWPDHCALLFTK